MNAKELATMLNGRTYGNEITNEEVVQAKAAGLVVVYGASDDLMEFEGAIHDELGCHDGGTAKVDAKGLLQSFEDIDKDDYDALKDFFKREDGAIEIEALWNKEPGYSWTYRTDIQHETFEIVEDGYPYCRGIVFALTDCLANSAQKPAPGAATEGYSTMQPHQQRVADEHADLEEKMLKLSAFINGQRFPALPEDEQSRLQRQLNHMTAYALVLHDRIRNF